MLLRGGVVDVARRDHVEAVVGGQPGERGVGRVGTRSGRELDEDVLEPEQRRQPVERLGRRARAVTDQRLRDEALAAAGQHRPVAAPTLAQLVEVVDRSPLLVAAQVGIGHRRGESVVALDPACQHEQVAALGVRHTVLRAREPQGQLGAEDGGQVVGRRCLGQHRSRVEAVVIGERERVQTQPDRLLHQRGR